MDEQLITAVKVSEKKRPKALARHFGLRVSLLVENEVYGALRKLSPDYQGGYRWPQIIEAYERASRNCPEPYALPFDNQRAERRQDFRRRKLPKASRGNSPRLAELWSREVSYRLVAELRLRAKSRSY